jgi:hypothetical protein
MLLGGSRRNERTPRKNKRYAALPDAARVATRSRSRRCGQTPPSRPRPLMPPAATSRRRSRTPLRSHAPQRHPAGPSFNFIYVNEAAPDAAADAARSYFPSTLPDAAPTPLRRRALQRRPVGPSSSFAHVTEAALDIAAGCRLPGLVP